MSHPIVHSTTDDVIASRRSQAAPFSEVRVRRGPLVLLLASLAACSAGPTRAESTPRGDVGMAIGPELGDGIKRVLTKDAPATLIAADGTVCRVSPDRFAETEVGDRVRCDWQLGAPRER